MKSYTILILTTIFNATNAFTVYSPDTRTTLSTGTSTITTSSTGLATATRRSKTSLGLATAEISDGKNNSRIGLDLDQSDMSPEESWQEYLQSREVQVSKNVWGHCVSSYVVTKNSIFINSFSFFCHWYIQYI